MALQLIHWDAAGQQALVCILLVMLGFSLAFVHAPTTAETNLSVQAETSSRPESFGGQGAIAQANSLFRTQLCRYCDRALGFGFSSRPIWLDDHVHDASVR